MPGYLEQIKQLHQGKTNEGINEAGSPQFHLSYEFDEINELRGALLCRLRTGQVWLTSQHQRWQTSDTTAADDAEFSRVWNGWWELDHALRTTHGFQGCIHGPDGACPEGFPCQGCSEISAPGVVAQLELAEMVE